MTNYEKSRLTVDGLLMYLEDNIKDPAILEQLTRALMIGEALADAVDFPSDDASYRAALVKGWRKAVNSWNEDWEEMRKETPNE